MDLVWLGGYRMSA